MPAVNNVLVVGGGLAGAATAIHLADGRRRRRPDRDQARRRRRSAPASRCRATRCASCASSASGTRCRRPATPSTSPASARPTRPARVVAEIPDAKTGGPDLPAAMGMPRPELARILSTGPPRSASRSGSARRSPSSTQDDDGVDVTFSDGSTGRYDLVVGADGIRSWTRRALGIDLETEVGRHGHLAGLRPAAGERHPHRPLLRRPVATSPATAPPARTRSTPTSSRTRRTAAR